MKLPKTMGGWAGFLLKVGGVVSISGPAINAVVSNINQPQQIPRWLVQQYTGFDPQTQQFNQGQMITSIASIGGGLILVKLGHWIGRTIR